jgi:hypothetical protein
MRSMSPNQPFDFGRRPRLCWLKDGDNAFFDRPTAFAIAAAGGLRQQVKAGLGSPDPWEVEIDARLDQGGRDDAARLLISETLAHVMENASPIGSGLSRRQMDQAIDACRLRNPIERQGMPAAIDDRQGREVRSANRLSNNCTLVVTITGARSGQAAPRAQAHHPAPLWDHDGRRARR